MGGGGRGRIESRVSQRERDFLRICADCVLLRLMALALGLVWRLATHARKHAREGTETEMVAAAPAQVPDWVDYSVFSFILLQPVARQLIAKLAPQPVLIA